MSRNYSVKPPPCVGLALGLTSQEWSMLGLGDDPAVAASSDLDIVVQRITALLVIRIIAWIQPRGVYADLSTTTICRDILLTPSLWPSKLTEEILNQVEAYTKVILEGYLDVPYHNFEHCYHVTVSANKLTDMILNASGKEKGSYTYGFRDDPLMQLVVIFSALVHDVGHRGIPNRQLVLEDDEVALLYNDQSVAEMRSIYVAFTELNKPEYEQLRGLIFAEKQDFRRFRDAVINLVLATDIASPDRAQIGKSKWKEAFGDPYETVERKVLKQIERRASLSSSMRKVPVPPGASRRMSAHSFVSELSYATPPHELDSDNSSSATPDSSDNEDEQIGNIGGGMAANGNEVLKEEEGEVNNEKEVGRKRQVPQRTRSQDVNLLRTQTAIRSARKYSIDNLDSSSMHSASGNMAGMASKFYRRLSAIGPSPGSSASKKHRHTRLGLLRTLDLSGEAIDTYQPVIARSSATGASTEVVPSDDMPVEDIDPLRETVVMETIMKAADVAHNLQGFDQMAKWSNRLFLELKRAYVQGRGDDPQGGWFSNQIGFLEAYLLPLARKLDDTGVFGDVEGAVFAKVVDDNKDRWMREGMAQTASIIKEGHSQFPETDSDEE